MGGGREQWTVCWSVMRRGLEGEELVGGGREVGEVSECCMALLRNLISHNYAIGNSRNIVLRLGKCHNVTM